MCDAVLALERAVRNMEALGQLQPLQQQQPPTQPPPSIESQHQPLPVSYPCAKPEPEAPTEPWCVVAWDGDHEPDGVYYSL